MNSRCHHSGSTCCPTTLVNNKELACPAVHLPVVHPLSVVQQRNLQAVIVKLSSFKTVWLYFIYNPCSVLTKDEGGSLLSDCLFTAVLFVLLASVISFLLPLHPNRALTYCVLHQGHSTKWWTVFCFSFVFLLNSQGCSCSQAHPRVIIRALLGCKISRLM